MSDDDTLNNQLGWLVAIGLPLSLNSTDTWFTPL